MSLESLYHETNRQLSEAHGRMGQLDGCLAIAGSPGPGEKVDSLQREISARIEQLISNCERLDVLVQKEPAARRLNAKVRVDQLKADVKHLTTAFRSLQARQWQREREAMERDQLLSMRFTTNEAARSSSSDSTSILIDRAISHNDALTRSNRAVDDLLGHGSAMLESLRNQRDTIKGFRRKLLDVANILGMSNTVMRLIEKRSRGDRLVLVGGILVTSFVMFLTIRYLT